MPRDLDAIRRRTLKRHVKVRTAYHKMRDKKKNGIPVYNEKFILQTIADEFGLSVNTVNDIVTFQYEKAMARKEQQAKGDANQLSILDELNDE